jgi:hypothetical protein
VIPCAAARWRGGPTQERVKWIRSHLHYDCGDLWRGRKIGATYGCLYHVIRAGLVPVKYSGHRMSEAVAGEPLYSWDDLRSYGL